MMPKMGEIPVALTKYPFVGPKLTGAPLLPFLAMPHMAMGPLSVKKMKRAAL